MLDLKEKPNGSEARDVDIENNNQKKHIACGENQDYGLCGIRRNGLPLRPLLDAFDDLCEECEFKFFHDLGMDLWKSK